VTLDAINAVAPILTAAIIAATAAAAFVQLRHMRASNHISAMWSVHEMFSSKPYRDALRLVRNHLQALMQDPAFRTFVTNRTLRLPELDAPEQFVAASDATTFIGNTYETLGNMIILGLIDRHNFLRNYAWIIVGMWEQMEPYVKVIRSAERGDGLYEDFEYLTVCAREWIRRNPVAYPRGYPRILPSYKDNAV